MPTPLAYFLYPWSLGAADDAVIPPILSPTGELSYNYGYTVNYEYDLLTNPAALPIPRTSMNQLFFDITSALQVLQTYGVPTWVSVAGGGPATGYPVGATVQSANIIYRSMIASNTVTPVQGDPANWQEITLTGKQLSSIVLQSAGISIGAGVAANITTLVVPAGNWNIFANGGNSFDSSAVWTQSCFWLATTNSLTVPDFSNVACWDGASDTTGTGGEVSLNCPFLNVNSATPTTIYLNTFPRYTGGSAIAYGRIIAQAV